MTIDMTNIRNSVSGVIDDYGSDITITPMTLTTDKWGDKTESDGTPVSTVGVPYDLFSERFNFITPGDLLEGDLRIIVKYDETIYVETGDTRYKITFDSQDYDVVSVEDYDVADITIAKEVVGKKRI